MKVKRKRAEESVDVSMSPLIDCVFLLLIFFLVTTMMKKKERRIPIQQPSSIVGLAAEISTSANYLGIKSDASIVSASRQRDARGRFIYQDVPDIEAYLSKLRSEGGTNEPLIIQIYGDVEFQQVLKVFDACTLAGFSNVKTTLDMDDFQYEYVAEDEAETKKPEGGTE